MLPRTRFLYLLPILVVALLLGAWFGRITLAEYMLVTVLQHYKLEQVVVKIHRLDPEHSQLSRFGFSQPGDAGTLSVDIHDINIHYDLSQLFDGRVSTISIDSLQVEYLQHEPAHTDATADQNTFNPADIIALLKQPLQDKMIASNVSIGQITFTGPVFAQLDGKSFKFDLLSKDQNLQLELTQLQQTTTGQHKTLRQIVIAKPAIDKVTATLKYLNSKQNSPANIEINIFEHSVAGRYVVKPAQLQHWLEPFVTVTTLNNIDAIKGTVKLDFASDKIITATVSAHSKQVAFDSYRADNLDINLVMALPVNTRQHTIQLKKASYIKADSIMYDNISTGMARIELQGKLDASAETWRIDSVLNSEQLIIHVDKKTFQAKNITANIKADPGKINAEGQFAPVKTPGQLKFTLEQNITKKHGRLSLITTEPIDLNADSAKLSQLWSPWHYPFDLVTGTITATARATWSQKKPFALTALLNIQQAGGFVDTLVFSGFAFEHELEVLPTLHSMRASKLNIKHIDSGVTVSNISANVSMDTVQPDPLPSIVIQDLHGEIFDGTFVAENTRYDLNNSSNHFTINANNIDLAKIIETQQLDDIKVTGRIDGSLPITIDEQGVSIAEGAFINDIRAGTIQYNPAAGTDQLKQNPLTAIALDALRDFRYSRLSAGVSFVPTGLLSVELQLTGTSPELDTKRPVNLNINTEQNLISLLKSLRYAKGVSTKIDNRVRRQYEKAQ